jgi:hypothetical protein
MQSGITSRNWPPCWEVPNGWVAGYERTVRRMAAADLIEMRQFLPGKTERSVPEL